MTYHQQWSISEAFWADGIDKTLLKTNSLLRKICEIQQGTKETTLANTLLQRRLYHWFSFSISKKIFGPVSQKNACFMYKFPANIFGKRGQLSWIVVPSNKRQFIFINPKFIMWIWKWSIFERDDELLQQQYII